jgi:Na+/proline symporter
VDPLLLAVLGYVVVQLLIGVAVSRGIKSEDDYLLAGRKLGYVLTTFSVFATWFGAESCVSAASEVYENGLSWSSTEPVAYGLAIALAGLLVAGRLWRKKLTTLADLFRTRYSPGVERFAALLLIPTSVFWAGAQIRAFGDVIASASDMSYLAATTLAASVVVLYTASGGMLADAVTDVVQGFALIVGLVVMLVAIVSATGGLEAAAASIEPAQIRLAPHENASFVELVETWAPPVLGSFVAQELVARMSSARSAAVARRSSIVAGFAYIAVGAIPVALGLLARGSMDPIDEPASVLPELARQKLSTLGYILFAGALVSAILSTVDSALLVASSLFSHNLFARGRTGADEAAKVRVARAGVIVFGIAAYGLALGVGDVGELIELTNGFCTAGTVVLLGFGLFTRFGGARAAATALALGSVVYDAGYVREWELTYVRALAAALGGYLAVAILERRASAR